MERQHPVEYQSDQQPHTPAADEQPSESAPLPDLHHTDPSPQAPSAGPDADSIADGTFRHVDPRSVSPQRISNWIVTAILTAGSLTGLIIFFAMGVLEGPAMLITTLIILLLLLWFGLLMHFYPKWAYNRKQYCVSRQGIEIHQGVWWRTVMNVPRSRIQHTDVTQGPLMRRYGVSTLVVHTAGTQNASVELYGLSHQRALAVRDFLIRGGEHDGV